MLRNWNNVLAEEICNYISENDMNQNQANLYLTTKMFTENLVRELSPSDMLGLLEFVQNISIEKLENHICDVDEENNALRFQIKETKKVELSKDTFRVLGSRKNKHECGVRITLDGHQELFVENGGFEFNVNNNIENLLLSVLDWSRYDKVDNHHVSRVKITGSEFDIDRFSRKIGY